jgi:uncharacterized CHY-type Zn-finger protein
MAAVALWQVKARPFELTATRHETFSPLLCNLGPVLVFPRKHALMSLFSSFIINPVVRQARRFSGATPPTAESGRPRLSHVSSLSSPAVPTSATTHGDAGNALLEDEPPAAGPARPRALTEELQRDALPVSHMHPAVGEQDRAQAYDSSRHHIPTAPMEIPTDVPASSSPLRPLHSGPADQNPSSANPLPSHNAPAMSESLPADDGMCHLRARIHEIRDLSIPDADKARLMHSLMTERYNFLRPTSPSSLISHDRPFTPTSAQSVFSEVHASSPISAASEVDQENPYNLRPGDTSPTYRPSVAGAEALDDDDADFEDEPALGCQHYKRNVKVQCYDCKRWYTCRHCHDALEDHNLNRAKTQHMLCMMCGTPQPAGEYCAHCGMQTACYYCAICKLWDNNRNKKIYHCVDCGICRRGEGLGKDYIHCRVGVCSEGCTAANDE